jgi:hypothetical protein
VSQIGTFEPDLRTATLVGTTRKPFDVLAEGLAPEKSRGDWTPLELFLAGVRGWKACLQQLIGRLADGK